MYYNQINQSTVELDYFYRIPIEEAEIYHYDSELDNLIPKFAKRKLHFKEYTEKKKQNPSLTSFFSEILKYEVKLKKDFIFFTRKEVENTIQNMIIHKIFSSKNKYDTYMTTMYDYMKWGYNQDPRLRIDLIRAKDFDFNWTDVITKDDIYSQVMTLKEMKFLTNKLDNPMNVCLVYMAIAGFTLEEALNLKKEQIKNCSNNTLTLINKNKLRKLKINEEILDMLLETCDVTEMDRQFRYALSKQPFTQSDYVIRVLQTKRSANLPVTKTTASNNFSRDVGNAGYDSSYDKFRTSSILNYYIELEKNIKDENEILELIYKRFNRSFNSFSSFSSVYKYHLIELKRKIQDEKMN